MSKLFVLPKGSDSSLTCMVLKHPKDWSDCMFYYYENESTLYELNIQKNQFYSCFMGDSLVKDGNIYLMTPVDPLFLLIPFIYKNTEKFQNLHDIFFDNNITTPHIEWLQNVFSSNILKCIADVKDFEDEVFIKFNKEKTLKWLTLKFENIKNSLTINGIGKSLSGFKVCDYVSGQNKFSEEEYKVLAFEMIADYMHQDLQIALRDKLGISDTDKDALVASTQNSAKVSNKRKMESDHAITSMDTDHKVETQISKELNKKPKMTRTQLALNKVDKTGIKSISSYFQRKK